MHVAGIDEHATYVVVAIVSNDGTLVQKPIRIKNTELQRLTDVLEPFCPMQLVVEASPAWPWLYDFLEGPGYLFVLAHPKKLRAIAEANYKSDAIDATLLARMRLVNLIPEVYCKPIEQRELNASRPRWCGRAWVHTVAWPLFGPEQQLLVRSHERIADGLKAMIKSLDRRIQEVGTEIPTVALLRTVPGIGPYRGVLIATETLPIERFKGPKHLVSYAGLAPRSSRSGMTIRYGPIPAGANRWLRNAFVQSVVIHRRRAPDSWLSRYYDQLKERLDWRVARIATARKLARAVHGMLRTGEVWRDHV